MSGVDRGARTLRYKGSSILAYGRWSFLRRINTHNDVDLCVRTACGTIRPSPRWKCSTFTHRRCPFQFCSLSHLHLIPLCAQPPTTTDTSKRISRRALITERCEDLCSVIVRYRSQNNTRRQNADTDYSRAAVRVFLPMRVAGKYYLPLRTLFFSKRTYIYSYNRP